MQEINFRFMRICSTLFIYIFITNKLLDYQLADSKREYSKGIIFNQREIIYELNWNEQWCCLLSCETRIHLFAASILVRNLFGNLYGVIYISCCIQVFASVSVPKQLFNVEQRCNRSCGFLFIRDTVHFACRQFLAFYGTDRSTRMHVKVLLFDIFFFRTIVVVVNVKVIQAKGEFFFCKEAIIKLYCLNVK